MLNFKQFVLQDARSNLELNPKVSINQRLKDYYNRAPKAPPNFGIKKNAFVSFTQYEKLGLNPDTKHNTPLAICSYSLEYALRKMGNERESKSSLPYAGNEPYANCFSVKGNIVNISKLEDFSVYVDRLKQYCKNKIKDDEVDQILKKGETSARIKTPGGIFWSQTLRVTHKMVLLNSLSRPYFNQYQPKNFAIMWNHILRSIGIDGLIDNGKGILHPSERSQQMFLHMGCIYNIERYDNKWSPNSIPLANPEKRETFLSEKRIVKEIAEKILNLFKDNNPQITHFPLDRNIAKITFTISLDSHMTIDRVRSILVREFGSTTYAGDYSTMWILPRVGTFYPQISIITDKSKPNEIDFKIY